MRFFQILFMTSVFVTSWAAAAMACEAGYCVQSTVPVDGAIDVPTDAQIFVFYDATPGLGEPEGSMTLAEGGGQGVLASVEVFPGENPMAEVQNRVAVLTPFAGLLPNTEYQVVFPLGAVCGEATLRFTTGSDTATQPMFGSAASATPACIQQPNELTSCNDQEPFPRLRFELSAEAASEAAAYAVYRDGTRISVVRSLPAQPQLLLEEVREQECFVLRAIAENGDEVGDGQEVCAMTSGVCPAATDPDMGAGPDMGGDMASEPDMDLGSNPGSDAGMLDMDTTDFGIDQSDIEDSGCACSSSSSADISALFLLFGLLGFRRLSRRSKT